MLTEGSAVSYENTHDHHMPAADHPSVPELEADEPVAPRPEEEIADVLLAEPDLDGHNRRPKARAASADDPPRPIRRTQRVPRVWRCVPSWQSCAARE